MDAILKDKAYFRYRVARWRAAADRAAALVTSYRFRRIIQRVHYHNVKTTNTMELRIDNGRYVGRVQDDTVECESIAYRLRINVRLGIAEKKPRKDKITDLWD